MKLFRSFLLFFSLSATMSPLVWAQDQSNAYYQAGNTLYGQKNYDQAIRYYQAAVQVNPQMWQADQGLGNCYYAKGDKANALTSYQKALAINPNNPGLASFVQTLQSQVGAAPALPASNAGTTPPAGAAPSSSENKFEIDIHAGVGMGGTGVGLGLGGGVNGFVPLGGNLFLGGMLSYFTFPITGTTLSESFIEALAGGKYCFSGDSFKPYLVAGLGMSNVSLETFSEMDPMVSIGGGAEIPAGKDMNFFAQVRYSMVMQNGGSSTYVPIEAGINFNL